MYKLEIKQHATLSPNIQIQF